MHLNSHPFFRCVSLLVAGSVLGQNLTKSPKALGLHRSVSFFKDRNYEERTPHFPYRKLIRGSPLALPAELVFFCHPYHNTRDLITRGGAFRAFGNPARVMISICRKRVQGVGRPFLSQYGCFRKWWYPLNTPKWSFLVGKPMVVGYHHFRKPPYCWTRKHPVFLVHQRSHPINPALHRAPWAQMPSMQIELLLTRLRKVSRTQLESSQPEKIVANQLVVISGHFGRHALVLPKVTPRCLPFLSASRQHSRALAGTGPAVSFWRHLLSFSGFSDSSIGASGSSKTPEGSTGDCGHDSATYLATLRHLKKISGNKVVI